MAKDKATSAFTLATELFDGDVKLSVSIRAAGVNAQTNQETVNTLKQTVQDKLLEIGSTGAQ